MAVETGKDTGEEGVFWSTVLSGAFSVDNGSRDFSKTLMGKFFA